MSPIDKTSRTFTLGEKDACIIFRDAPELEGCKIDIVLETRHLGQNHLPERKSSSFLALLASTAFQSDTMALLIHGLSERHLESSGGIDTTPLSEGKMQ